MKKLLGHWQKPKRLRFSRAPNQNIFPTPVFSHQFSMSFFITNHWDFKKEKKKKNHQSLTRLSLCGSLSPLAIKQPLPPCEPPSPLSMPLTLKALTTVLSPSHHLGPFLVKLCSFRSLFWVFDTGTNFVALFRDYCNVDYDLPFLYTNVFISKKPIPYCTGWYSRYLSYRSVNGYRNTYVSFRFKFRPIPDYTSLSEENRMFQPVKLI